MIDIHLQPKELQIVKDILNKYPYKFYAFGSRVTGKQKKFSDLDLCYKEQIPLAVVAEIEAGFAESDLPFKVDLVNWDNCSDDFRQLITKDLVSI